MECRCKSQVCGRLIYDRVSTAESRTVNDRSVEYPHGEKNALFPFYFRTWKTTPGGSHFSEKESQRISGWED